MSDWNLQNFLPKEISIYWAQLSIFLPPNYFHTLASQFSSSPFGNFQFVISNIIFMIYIHDRNSSPVPLQAKFPLFEVWNSSPMDHVPLSGRFEIPLPWTIHASLRDLKFLSHRPCTPVYEIWNISPTNHVPVALRFKIPLLWTSSTSLKDV